MTRGIRLGAIRGIEIVADVSLVALGLLLTWSLWALLGREFPEASDGALTAVAIAGGGLFIVSVLVHELSHSLLALRRGIEVRRIRLFIFGGYSEIARDASDPGDEFVIAAAGPAASIAIGVTLLGVGSLPAPELVGRMLRIVGIANLLLAGFNLVPGFPLDGGRVLRAAVWGARGDRSAATKIATTAGRIVGALVIAAGGFFLIRPGGALAGIWYLAIGWFLLRGATTAQFREDLLARIAGRTAADVMRPLADSVPGDLFVADVIERYAFGPRLRDQAVAVDGRIRGLLGAREVDRVPADRRSGVTAAEAMSAIGPADVVDAGTSLEDLLARSSGRSGRAVVTSEGRVVGLITGEEVAHLFERRR